MTKTLTTTILTLVLAAAAFASAVPGEPAPDFTLTDTDGVEHALSTYLEDGKTVVLEWFNPDCPFIRKHHTEHKTMNETFAAAGDDVVWLCINSNAEGKQGHGLERNRKAREDYGMDYPILLDPDGKVGTAYGAKTTPHMFVIAADGKVAYQGAIDSDRSAKKIGETNYVADALRALAAGEAVAEPSTRAYGCSVKY